MTFKIGFQTPFGIDGLNVSADRRPRISGHLPAQCDALLGNLEQIIFFDVSAISTIRCKADSALKMVRQHWLTQESADIFVTSVHILHGKDHYVCAVWNIDWVNEAYVLFVCYPAPQWRDPCAGSCCPRVPVSYTHLRAHET